MKLQDLNSITSREIAMLTGKRHADLLREVRKMEADWQTVAQSSFTQGYYKLKATGNQEHPMFILTKTESLYIATKFNNVLRAKVIKRWEQLELNHQDEQKRIHQRELAKMGCPKMTNALVVQRLESGKGNAKPHHYSNEHNMIYRIVLGATAKKFKEAQDIDGNLRDGLTPLQIEAVTKIQDMNTSLIDLGFEYKERKQRLDAFYEKRYAQKLMDEFNRINA